MKKQTKEGAIITADESVSIVMKDRYTHGEEWQDYISDKFEEVGIQPVFHRIKDALGERIADYQYEGVWVEAKTFINNAEVAKIKTLYEKLITLDTKMVIMCEWDPGSKKHAKDVKLIRSLGIYVFEGQSQCDSCIIDESVRLNAEKTVKMSLPISIEFNQLIPHPNNREVNSKNIPTIKASIVKNGFFTQINVVEHEMKEIDGVMKMTYMIFEGHTRYYSLQDLYNKGYEIPPIACILVPWVSSKDINVLHKMLITTNTTYSGWKLKNYVTSHRGNLDNLGDVSGVFSYGKILQAMNQAKKQKWGEANPVYLFCHTNSLAFDDMKAVKDGSYRITEIEYKEQVHPILELMNQISSKDKNGEIRNYNGTIIRDILVDIRIMYNTNPVIFDNFRQFLGFLKLKFISSYDIGTFPDTKETGQKFWDIVKSEYIGLRQLGLAGNVQPFETPKTIENFI
jgi:hypothetical protein